MRIAYYTHPAFFEAALSLVRALSQHAAVDLLLEVSHGAWQSASFDCEPRSLPEGLVPADPILADAFPAGVRAYWRSADSFHLVVHRSRRSFHRASWRVSREALRFVAARGADLLHVDDVDVSPRLALAIPGAARPPIVISVHDPEPHSGERDWRRGVARRLAYRAASRFVLYNQASREQFAATHPRSRDRVVVTHLGPYDVFREWEPGAEPPAAPPVVLFFGRLSPYKGLDVFYRAVPEISRRLGRVRFVAAGRPIEGYQPPPPPPTPVGCELEVVDRYLSNVETAALFRSASVVVCPYRDATQSGVVLTAFAFGVPVVATRAGGLPEYVVPEQTGLLVPVNDAAAIADATCRIVEDAALAARLRQGIEVASAGFLSWRNTGDALLATYREVISERGC